MGSILSAINDDEEVFNDFLKASNLIGKYNGSPYSEKSAKLRSMFNLYRGKLKGRLLLAAVQAEIVKESEIVSANSNYDKTISSLLTTAEAIENTDLK